MKFIIKISVGFAFDTLKKNPSTLKKKEDITFSDDVSYDKCYPIHTLANAKKDILNEKMKNENFKDVNLSSLWCYNPLYKDALIV